MGLEVEVEDFDGIFLMNRMGAISGVRQVSREGTGLRAWVKKRWNEAGRIPESTPSKYGLMH